MPCFARIHEYHVLKDNFDLKYMKYMEKLMEAV